MLSKATRVVAGDSSATRENQEGKMIGLIGYEANSYPRLSFWEEIGFELISTFLLELLGVILGL